jgi:D-alanyl-D-alanine carboxypeptidase
MASTTKIMTAVLVLENLSLDQEVTVSEKAAQTPEPKTLLRAGDVATVEQLMYALLIRSSNGAAVALAEACDGSVDAFLERMNSRAEQLGMADTHFMNPNGLDADGHYSTAADMAKVAQYAMKNERFREFVSTPSYNLELPGRTEPILLKNTNKLLGRVDWVTGIKTGLTPRAEQCLVASATRDGVSVISVLLGQPSSDVCWDESQALLDYGLGQFRHVTLMEEGTVVAQSDVPYQADGVIRLVTKDPLETDLYKDDDVTTLVKLERPLALPVEAGEEFGQVLLAIDGETVKTVALVADRSVEEITLGSKIAYLWDRIAGLFGA